MQQENVVAQQVGPEETGVDCVQHEGPDANSGGVTSPLAMRIRSLREGAGMSQARLAELVFVSRQTVINWEKGRTLPDAESLKRLSAAFGITLDALLDDRSEEYLRQTERERKTIWVAIALDCMWFVWQPIDLFVNVLAFKYLDWDRAYAISNVVDAVDWFLLLASSVGFSRSTASRPTMVWKASSTSPRFSRGINRVRPCRRPLSGVGCCHTGSRCNGPSPWCFSW